MHFNYHRYCCSFTPSSTDKLELSQKIDQTNDTSTETNVELENNNNLDVDVSSHILPLSVKCNPVPIASVPLHENNSLSEDCTHFDKATAFSKSSPYAEAKSPPVGNILAALRMTSLAIIRPFIADTTTDSNTEVELISLIEETIPKYKLRIDSITEFTGLSMFNDYLL